jgi:aminopeptidase N
MGIDSRAGTHPVITPIRDVLEAFSAFDVITYQKGQAVIGMLEAYLGEDAFRKGVAACIKRHAYGNTVSDDLWAEIEAASARPVRDIAHDFTRQAGVPLIRAEPSGPGLTLSQDRYYVDEPAPPPQAWRVPVVVRAAGGEFWRDIVGAGPPAPAGRVIAKGAVVNAGQTGQA